MRILIKNLAKIKKANIEIDGITVICGNNNTGTSTVGKVLFYAFESNNNLNNRIKTELITKIISVCNEKSESNDFLFLSENFAEHVVKMVDEAYYSNNDPDIIIESFIDKILDENLYNNEYQQLKNSKKIIPFDKIKKNTSNAVKKILKSPINNIKKELIWRYFDSVFNKQINNVYDEDSNASIVLSIKDKKNKIVFKKSKCVKFEENIGINKNIYYIDNPFIIDKIKKDNKYTSIEKKLIDSFNKDYTDNMTEDIIESVQNKGILKKIKKLFDDAVNGKINYIGGVYHLDKIRFENLSTGIKSFLIIRVLLENGSLKEKDLLVLDEPEIHLHPEWQLTYAEIIVLLQKYLNLTITITTHSPYFLEAINRFSIKHKIKEKINFYMSEYSNNSEYVIIKNVNNNIDLIFQKMADPLRDLRRMRIEEFDNE